MTSVPMRLAILTLCLHLLAALHAAETRDTMPDTCAATDAPGRVLPMNAEVGTPKANRTVGIFYFN